MTDESEGAMAVERRLLDPAVRRDPQALGALLADDFVEIGASGRVWTRNEIIAELGTESAVGVTAVDAVQTSDWTVRPLAPGLAMVRFVSVRAGLRVRRTSLYRQEDGSWRAFFHQATLAD